MKLYLISTNVMLEELKFYTKIFLILICGGFVVFVIVYLTLLHLEAEVGEYQQNIKYYETHNTQEEIIKIEQYQIDTL